MISIQEQDASAIQKFDVSNRYPGGHKREIKQEEIEFTE